MRSIYVSELCRKCKGEFHPSEYQITKYNHMCQRCNRDHNREYNRINRDKLIARRRKYNTSKLGRISSVRRIKKYRNKYPEKYHATIKVGVALRNGSLVRKSCEGCGGKKVHAHHDDYKKPLDVRWLCQPCHWKFHNSKKVAS